jgi:hypothetical protein
MYTLSWLPPTWEDMGERVAYGVAAWPTTADRVTFVLEIKFCQAVFHEFDRQVDRRLE